MRGGSGAGTREGVTLAGRRRTVLAVVLGSTLVSVGGLSASLLVKSPAQVAAEAAAPAPSVLSAVVERRVLRDTVVLRGTVASERSVEATPSASREGGELVVTGVRVRQGQAVSAGQALVEVSGRPLIALPGPTPAYRDLLPGARGKDVAQLQAALRRVGHDPDDQDAVFGPGTKRALAALYADLGYEAATTGEEDARAVEAARRAVRQAELALAQARAGQPASGGTPEVRQAEEALAAARAELAGLEAHSGVMLPVGEVVFLPGFPARVDRLRAVVGRPVTPPLLTLSAGDLLVRAMLQPADRSLVKVGQRVQVAAEALGLTAAGKVAAIGELGAGGQDGGGDAAGPHGAGDAGDATAQDTGAGHPVTVKADRRLGPRWLGQDVRVTVEAASTGAPVLVVPLAAVSATADGRTQVIRLARDREEAVTVAAGVSGDGFVAVEPVGGTLAAGDRVVIGQRS
jgi:HlyD family secretion protein